MIALSLIAASAESGKIEVGWVTSRGGLSGLELPIWRRCKPSYHPGEFTLRKWIGRCKHELDETIKQHEINVLLPLLDIRHPVESAPVIGWVPDFQDRALPEYTPEVERRRRSEITTRLTRNCSAILLSSRTAERHFREYHSSYFGMVATVPFPSLFAFENPPSPSGQVQRKYAIPERFILVANQFWAHKNHGVVIEAVRILASRGIKINVVLTGLPLDHRDPQNHSVSSVLQQIAAAQLRELIIPLGQVPFSELIELMQRASIIVQPSRFEGWSTTVQDARALGTPVLCSEIPVHREQLPPSNGFFDPDDAEGLALLIEREWEQGAERERSTVVALEQERKFARLHGQRLLDLCQRLSEKGAAK